MQIINVADVTGGIRLEIKDGNAVRTVFVPAVGTAGAMPQMLPAATAADEGKTVTVDENGKYVLTAAAE